MTVKELRDWLSVQDPHMRIVVKGYEGGFCDLQVAQQVTLQRDANKDDPYCGPHMESALGDPHLILCATENGRD